MHQEYIRQRLADYLPDEDVINIILFYIFTTVIVIYFSKNNLGSGI